MKYDDDDKALLLLRSLLSSFKHFRTTIMFGKESLKLDEVMEAIQSYVKMDENTEGSQAHGLYAKGKERGRSQSRHDKSGNRGRSKSKGKEKENKGCFTCGATDHWKKNCKIWQERKAKAMARNSSSASVVTSDESDGELLAVTSSSNAFQHWILDTGCSFHMCANKEWFDTYEEKRCGEVLMGDDSPCKIQGIGSVKIRMHDGIVRVLDKVRHVPKLKKNLISLGTLDKAGYKYCSEGGILKVIKGLLVMMRGDIQPNTLYKLRGTTIVGGAAVSVEKDETELWHCRLGHMSQRGMQELHKKNQLKGVSFCKLKFCKYCTLGKQTKTSFKIADSEKRSKEPLYYIHTDVWGPAPTRSKGGSRYFVTFLDDFSRKVWVYFMREKSEVFTKFKEWKAEVENQTGRKIRYLRSDNGGEYRDNKFLQFCREEGITRHFTVKKTPRQNGAAERMNRTLMERERSMRFHAGLPDMFWAEAVNHACYLVNRSPSRVLDYKCAEEVWSRKPVDYSNLRVFGCSAYAHISSDERTKLKPKSLECIFIGFEKGVKGYKLWDFVNKKKVLSRDVVFDEKTMPLNKIKTAEEKQTDVVEEATEFPLTKWVMEEDPAQVEHEQVDHDEGINEERVEQQQQSQVQAQVELSPLQEQDSLVPQQPEQQFQRSIALDKPKRERKKPEKYGFDQDEVNYALNVSQGDPTTYQEAIASDDRESWMVAMSEEMQSLDKNSVWELVSKPKDRKIVGCKWVFRKKEGTHEGDAVRYKARLVAKGYSQKEGVDYDEIFSPVVKHTSIRLLLSIAAQQDMEIEQMDVKTAFLHGDLEEVIYMAQLEGYVETGKENLVCRLKKSLYVLK